MDIEELYDLADWMSAWLKPAIVDGYGNLHSKILTSARQPNQAQGFEEEKDALIRALKNLPLDRLSRAQISTLEHLELTQFLGDAGIDYVNGILRDNALDGITAAQKIQNGHAQIVDGLDWAENAFKALSEVIVRDRDHLEGNAAMLHVHFEGGASLDHFKDLKDWSSRWFLIARGISRAVGETPESIRIVSASRGSIVFDAVATLGTAMLFAKVIKSILEAQKAYFDVQIAKENARRVVADNERIQKEFDKELEAIETSGVKRVSMVAVEVSELDDEKQADEIQELERAVRNLFEFMKQGGDVDIAVTGDDDEDAEDGKDFSKQRETLRELMSEARSLSSEVRRLTHVAADDSDKAESDSES